MSLKRQSVPKVAMSDKKQSSLKAFWISRGWIEHSESGLEWKDKARKEILPWHFRLLNDLYFGLQMDVPAYLMLVKHQLCPVGTIDIPDVEPRKKQEYIEKKPVKVAKTTEPRKKQEDIKKNPVVKTTETPISEDPLEILEQWSQVSARSKKTRKHNSSRKRSKRLPSTAIGKRLAIAYTSSRSEVGRANLEDGFWIAAQWGVGARKIDSFRTTSQLDVMLWLKKIPKVSYIIWS